MIRLINLKGRAVEAFHEQLNINHSNIKREADYYKKAVSNLLDFFSHATDIINTINISHDDVFEIVKHSGKVYIYYESRHEITLFELNHYIF